MGSGNTSRRGFLFGLGGSGFVLAGLMTSSPAYAFANVMRRDLRSRSTAFKAAMQYFLSTHGQDERSAYEKAISGYVGSAEEQDFQRATSNIFRTGGVMMETPARDSADALHKYLTLSEFYQRMSIEDASHQFTMDFNHWMTWLDALDADLDRFEVDVNRWWKAGALRGVYIDGTKYKWGNGCFHPMEEWYDVA